MHLDRPSAEQAAREAGADAVFPRATRPSDMVGDLTALASASAPAGGGMPDGAGALVSSDRTP